MNGIDPVNNMLPLSQQLAALQQRLRAEIEKWQHLDGCEVKHLPSIGEPMSSSAPSSSKNNLHDTEMGLSSAVASRSIVGYTKLKTCSDMSGELYEVKMVVLLFLRCINRAQHFYLGANMDAAGQFDDVILKMKLYNQIEWLMNFIQLKHKQKAKVTQSALLSLSKNDFGIVKYCHSYLGVKSKMSESNDLQFCGQFEKINFIIYTNAYIDKDLEKPDRKMLSDLGTPIISTSSSFRSGMFCLDPLLDGVIYQGLEDITTFKAILVELNRCYECDQDNLPGALRLLSSFVVTRHSINGELVRIVEKLKQDPSEANVKVMLNKDLVTVASFSHYQEFAEKLQIFTGQANEKELDALIKEEIVIALKISDVQALHKIFIQITNDVQAWWRDSSYFLTEDATFWYNIVSSHIAELSAATVNGLQKSGLSFHDSQLKIVTHVVFSSRAVNMLTKDGSSFLTMLKVYQALEERCCVFVSLESLLQRQDEILCAWRNRWCRKLVIDCTQSSTHEIPHRLYADLYSILKDSHDLSLILVSNTDSSFSSSLKETLVVDEFESINQFSQLSKESQTALLKKEVTFQDQVVPFTSLIGEDDHLINQLKGNSLMQLLKSELKIGPALDNAVEYYIPRQLVCNDSEPFCVDCVSDVRGRVVLIIAEPGMGKTTLFSHLAVTTKRYNPTKWVVRINLNDCTTYLAGLKAIPRQEIESVRFLIKNALTNSTILEDTLFKHSLQSDNTMVVFIDSVDEVCPLYENEVCLLLNHLLDTGIEKLCVTSRPTLKDRLEKTLNTSSFSLVPFTRNDQENFLCKYWHSKTFGDKFGSEHRDLKDDKRLIEFVGQVLSLAADVFKGDDLVISIPQQTLMLAELFEVEFANYCKGVGEVKLPQKLDIILLYESFVHKKFDVFVYEKKKVSRDNAAVIVDNENTLEIFWKNHMAASLILLLTIAERSCLPSFSESDAQRFLKTVSDGLEKNGILIGMANGMPCFVHRTFAEYFGAVWFKENSFSSRDFLKCHLFELRFSVVKSFFDYLLAQNCPLHLAVLSRDIQTLQELLAGGFDVDARDGGGRTALHLAAGYVGSDADCECSAIVQLLLEHGALVDLEDSLFEWRPLRYADQTQAWIVAGLILRKGGHHDDLVEAKSQMKDEVFDVFVNHLLGVELSCARLTLVASKYGDLKVVRYSTEVCGGDVNCRSECGDSPMHRAAEGGHIHVMQFLNENGISYIALDDNNNTPLHSATRFNQEAAIVFLLDHGLPVNAANNDGWSSLMFASKLGLVDVVSHLLKHGADVNTRAVDGWTPLLCAADEDNITCLKLLLASGAQVKINMSETSDQMKNLALLCVPFVEGVHDIRCFSDHEEGDFIAVAPSNLSHSAAMNNSTLTRNELTAPCISLKANVEIAKQLIDNGASVNYTNKHGKLALHYAAMRNDFQLVSLLIEKGANINQSDNKGFCPLHCTVMIGTDNLISSELEPNRGTGDHVELMQLLLNNGANITHRAFNGKSFRDIALDRELSDVIEYFFPLDDKLASALKIGNVNDIKELVSVGARVDPVKPYVHTMLVTASREGNLNVVRLLLEGGANVNTCDRTGRCLLLLAALNKKWEVVRYLVEMGGDCTTEDKDGRSVLHLSLHDLEVVQLLCNNGANVNTRDNLDLTPLITAAESGSLEIVNLLVDEGADIEAVDAYGRSVFHIVCDHFNFDLIHLLLKKGCNVHTSDLHGYTPLMSTSRSKVLDVVEILVDNGVDINAVDNTGVSALHVASSYTCNLDLVQFLVEHGASVNKLDHSDQSPLLNAANGTAWDSLKYLVEQGADVNACNLHSSSALHMSVADIDSVKLLIASGANVNKCDSVGRTPLLSAVFSEKWDTAEYLLTIGVDVNVIDTYGFSALHLASEAKHCGLVRLLASIGTDLNTHNKDGWSALSSAVNTNSWEVAKLLIEVGADVNDVDKHGRSLFHMACDSQNLDMMTYLVEKGLNVRTSDNDGWTPLMSAIANGCFVVAMFLLDRGSNVEAVDSKGCSALHVACDKKDKDMIWLLMERGFNIDVYQQSIWKTLILCAAKTDAWDVVKLCVETPNIARHTKVRESAMVWAIGTAIPEIVNYVTNHMDEFAIVIQSTKMVLPDSEDGGLQGKKELVKHNVNNSMGFGGRVPLFLAARGGHVDLVQYLKDNLGCDLNTRGDQGGTLLFEASSAGKLEMVIFLLNNGADINALDNLGRSAIFNAAILGRSDVVFYLIKQGANIHLRDTDGKSVLSESATWGRLDIVQCLVEHGVDVNMVDNRGRSSLFDAVTWGRLDVCRYLIAHGADPNLRSADNDTVLYIAAVKGSTGALELLIEFGVDPNEEDSNGKSAIFNAAVFSKLDEVRCLIKNGANPNHRDKEGFSALFGVASIQLLPSVQCLIENGTDPNLRDNRGRSAIFLAANVNSVSTVQYLIEHGADPNLRDNNGRNALYEAAAVKAINAMRYLIDHGADPYLLDNEGKSVLQLANSSTLESLGLIAREQMFRTFQSEKKAGK